MSTREFDWNDPPRIDLGGDRGAELARVLAPTAPVLALPRRRGPPDKAEPRRFSRLRLMDESALHYAHGFVEETSPMRKGTALHAYLLGQEHRVVGFEDGKRDLRFAKYQAFLEKHPDKHVLSPGEAEQVFGMRDSIRKNPRAMALLEGQQERRMEWDFGGRKCAGTPDSVFDFPKHRRLTELKATHTTKPARLKVHGHFSHWHAQLSWYSDGLDRTMSYPRLPVEEHYVVAVAMKAPYPVTELSLTPKKIAEGAKIWRRWWEALEVCEQSDHFPAYSEADVEWDVEEASDPIDWEDDDDEAA